MNAAGVPNTYVPPLIELPEWPGEDQHYYRRLLAVAGAVVVPNTKIEVVPATRSVVVTKDDGSPPLVYMDQKLMVKLGTATGGQRILRPNLPFDTTSLRLVACGAIIVPHYRTVLNGANRTVEIHHDSLGRIMEIGDRVAVRLFVEMEHVRREDAIRWDMTRN